MSLLSEHIQNNCDQRLAGVLSLAVRQTYDGFHTLVDQNPILQSNEMRWSRSFLIHGIMNLMVEQALVSSGISHNIQDKTTCKYSNGHTYFLAEVDGATITPKKLCRPSSFPKKAKYRSELSSMNKGISLFDEFPEYQNKEFTYREDKTPFLLLTYGAKNEKLTWVNLALPDFEMKCWVDRVDITHSLALLPNKKQMEKEMNLTLTEHAKQLIEEKYDHAREEGI